MRSDLTADQIVAGILSGDLPVSRMPDAVIADLIHVLEARQQDADTRVEHCFALIAAAVKAGLTEKRVGTSRLRADPKNARAWLCDFVAPDVADRVIESLN